MRNLLIITFLLSALWSSAIADIDDSTKSQIADRWQTDNYQTGADSNDFSSRGGRGRHSDISMIFESGLLVATSSSNRPEALKSSLLMADLGLLFPITDNGALGGSLFMLTDDDDTRFGVKPRYRRWLEGGHSLDLAAGFTFEKKTMFGLTYHPGLILSLSLAAKNLGSIDLVHESYRLSFEDSFGFTPSYSNKVTTVYLGITGRNWAALVPAGFYLITMLIEASSFNGFSWQ